MASSKWKKYEELTDIVRDKKVILWGASDWVGKTLDHIVLPVECIVDHSALNQGVVYEGFEVRSPDMLRELDKDKHYIIITTGGHYLSVVEELQEMGYIMGDHFCCSPELNRRQDKEDILTYTATVLFSSPEHTFDDTSGGGLYTYAINPAKIEKVYAGKCRGVVRADDNFYVADMLRGIVILNSDFSERSVITLQKNSEPHGITVDSQAGQVLISQPGRDSIARYDIESQKQVGEIRLSEKWSYNKKDNHHINDLCLYGNSIFCSMFSFSGNWPSEVYDGGVIEIDKTTDRVIGPVISGMWMPHSIQRVNSELVFLNSMRGELRSGVFKTLGSFPHYTRGLAFDGRYYYIGTSEHAYPEKLEGFVNNIGLDGGFYLFDPKTKMSKFFKAERTNAVHSIITL